MCDKNHKKNEMKEKVLKNLNKVRFRLKKLSLKLLCKMKKLFSEKAFSKGQMIIFCGIIIWGSIMYQDFLRFITFVIGTMAGWFTGYMGFKRVRDVLEKAEQAINNPLVPIDKKYVEAVGAVHTSCDYLGRVMDRYNLQQGTAPYLRDLKKFEEKKLEKGGEKIDG